MSKYHCSGRNRIDDGKPVCEYEGEKDWTGKRCPSCGRYYTVLKIGSDGVRKVESTFASLGENKPKPRISTGYSGFDEVLGGGLVKGSSVLLSGGPGLGKSTLVLQSADKMASRGLIVVYASGEQNSDDIGDIARRLGLKSENVKVLGIDKDGGEMYHVTDLAEEVKADVLVVDSLQSAQCSDVAADEGSPNQCKAVANFLTAWGKREKVSIIIICQITKDGETAGPKAAQHYVDTLLDFVEDYDIDENGIMIEKTKNNRLLISGKNRNGAMNVEARFRMLDDGTGLEPIRKKSKLKLVEKWKKATEDEDETEAE
jgi:DNA repair protein RadA/Sms